MELFYHSFCTGSSFDSVVISLCVTLSPSSQTCLSMAIKCQRTKPCGQPMSLSLSLFCPRSHSHRCGKSFIFNDTKVSFKSITLVGCHSFVFSFHLSVAPSSSLSHSLGPLSFHSLFTSLAALSTTYVYGLPLCV